MLSKLAKLGFHAAPYQKYNKKCINFADCVILRNNKSII